MCPPMYKKKKKTHKKATRTCVKNGKNKMYFSCLQIFFPNKLTISVFIGLCSWRRRDDQLTVVFTAHKSPAAPLEMKNTKAKAFYNKFWCKRCFGKCSDKKPLRGCELTYSKDTSWFSCESSRSHLSNKPSFPPDVSSDMSTEKYSSLEWTSNVFLCL